MAVDTVTGAVVDKLKSEASVTSLTTKITANIADQESAQSTDPYVVVVLDSVDPEASKDGTGIVVVDVGVEIYHEDIKDATDIANAIESVLEGYSGIHGTIVVQEMWLFNALMAFDSEVEQHGHRMQFRVRQIKQ